MDSLLIDDKQSIQKISTIRSLPKFKDETRGYLVFANYVYDSECLRRFHPGGYQIIISVLNKEIDRYIYGMFASEQLPQVKIWTHTFRSFKLMDGPIAKICIPAPWTGFTGAEQYQVRYKLTTVNAGRRLFELWLQKADGRFTFKGYETLAQLGRYYAIRMDDSVTRLYTSVNFMVEGNKRFMERVLPLISVPN